MVIILWVQMYPSDRVTVIGMDGVMATMSHSDFKCPIGKGSVETMSHYFLET